MAARDYRAVERTAKGQLARSRGVSAGAFVGLVCFICFVPLVRLVCLVCLVCFVCFVPLVRLRAAT
ncbi:hypothetical protein WME79_10695 [Sorangium sp. So ce726]|uniref:hypothetical protein n=1 Tax=Sorangium sp. So ce726 TaxID=3133319 RepID=UPI003F600F27